MGQAVDPEEVKESKQQIWPEVIVASILIAGIVIAALFEIPTVVADLYVGFINIIISIIFLTIKLVKSTTESEKMSRYFTSCFLQYFNMCLIQMIMGQT